MIKGGNIFYRNEIKVVFRDYEKEEDLKIGKKSGEKIEKNGKKSRRTIIILNNNHTQETYLLIILVFFIETLFLT